MSIRAGGGSGGDGITTGRGLASGASGGSAGGWMSTKKDQCEIVSSRQQALDLLKKHKQKKTGTTTSINNKNKTKKNGVKKLSSSLRTNGSTTVKRRNSKSVLELDDDDEEEEDFDLEEEESDDDGEGMILGDDSNDDDDEVDETIDENNDVEEVTTELHPSARTKNSFQKQDTGNASQNPIAVDDDEGDVDSDEGANYGSFLPQGIIRNSVPSRLMRQKKMTELVLTKYSKQENGKLKATTMKKNHPQRMKRRDSLTNLEPTRKTIGNQRSSQTRRDDSDSDDVLTSPEPRIPKKNATQTNFSKHEEDKKHSYSSLVNLKRKPPAISTPSKSLHPSNKNGDGSTKEGATHRGEFWHLVDTPDQPKLKKRRFAKHEKSNADDNSSIAKGSKQKIEHHILVDSDGDDSVECLEQPKVLKRKKSIVPTKKEEITINDSDDSASDEDIKVAMRLSKKEQQRYSASDEDIKVAMRQSKKEHQRDNSSDEDIKVAMRLSKKEHQRQNAKPKLKQFKDDDSNEVIFLGYSSDEDVDDRDDTYDEKKEAASSVLKTAEQLSAQVVQAMAQWSGRNIGSGSQGSQGSVIQGIIMDGAVSLATLEGNNVSSNSSDHQWISQQQMERACPNVDLSDYQLVGVNWLALLHGMKCKVGKNNTNVNGVLADEMGLGKTVQTIAFLAWLAHERKTTTTIDLLHEYPLPHLIVVPVSTLPNWIREFQKFCPEMCVVKYHGSAEERANLNEVLREHHPKYRVAGRLPKTPLDVIIAPTTYFQKENSNDRKFLTGFRFEYLVIDEAHSLKNSKSTRYKMLDKVNSLHRLLLTGTPVQNNPQELLNMLSFIMPLFSRAGSSFDQSDKENYTEQMLKYFVDEKLEMGDDQQGAYAKLKQLFAPFVLRRKKDEVISQLLPSKERRTEFVELNASAREIYDNILLNHIQKCDSKLTAAIGEHLFTNLRKAAHHPLMLRTRHTTPAEKDHLAECFYRFGAFQGEGCTKARVEEELSKFSDFHIHLTALELLDANPNRESELRRYILQQDDLFCSAKFERLESLLPQLIAEQHRILIFSSWTSCLDLLGCLMEHLGLKYQRMDGSIQSAERQRLIDQFNEDDSYKVFLLSTKACGLGINLTSADTCIIHDLDFNPFNDQQAEDRCHRIGQTKKVTVYKLVAKDTVDSDIYQMQQKKTKMNDAIMESNNSSSKKLKQELLQTALDRIRKSPKGAK